MRALSVVGQIVNIEPIIKADRIELATVNCGHNNGTWSGVIQKESFVIGQKVVVFLQDAKLPPDPRWSFLEKDNYIIRFQRMRGAPSECLILEFNGVEDIGTEVSALYGVTKYEKPIPVNLADKIVGFMPSNIPQTDEINFQMVENWNAKLQADDFYITEKADGTSCTVWNDDNGFHVCNRTLELLEFPSGASPQQRFKDGDVYWKTARKYQLDRIPAGIALQFEVVGPGINKNPMGLNDTEMRLFKVYDIKQRKYLPLKNLLDISIEYNIPTAKILNTNAPLKNDISNEDLRKLAEIKYNNGHIGEGIVIQDINCTWSFKVINLLYKD